MVKYKVMLMAKAYRDLDEVYSYIVENYKEIGTAEHMADLLETTILSLNEMPYRGAIRRTGAYANRGYRQLFVKNFTIVYRILDETKTVIVVTVRYTPCNF